MTSGSTILLSEAKFHDRLNMALTNLDTTCGLIIAKIKLYSMVLVLCYEELHALRMCRLCMICTLHPLDFVVIDLIDQGN